MENETLIKKAMEARKYSYAPYSKFKVGAALQTTTGKIYTGCNVENAAYSPCNCAERTAIFKAVSEGEKSFEKIVVAGGYVQGEEMEGFVTPCGVCRQVMIEFCNPRSFRIIVAKSPKDYREYSLEELFPMGFGPENL